jgi:uncharacterized protein involved in exopolysaccharide biosynthesis
VAVVGSCFAVAAWGLSKRMDRAYLAETSVMLAKDSSSNSLSSMAGQLGGVAALLGTNIPGNGDVNEALATLRSRQLVTEFLRQERHLADVDALVKEGKGDPLDSADRVSRAVDFFQERVLNVEYDARSALISVSVTWRDRQMAATWANAYVSLANEAMRKREIEEARNRITFLRAAAERAETVDLRQAIYRLIEAQIRAEMLATTRPEFAFRVVDPAVPALSTAYVRPKSALMGLVAGLLGALLAAGVVALLPRKVATAVPR